MVITIVVVVSGSIVDILGKRIYKGLLRVENGRIVDIKEKEDVQSVYILPGLVDAHIHIESSLLVPSQYAKLALSHGVIAAICDPHEIGNVMGKEGIEFMLSDGKKVKFKFYFGAPPCVPATEFERSGAELGVSEIEELLGRDDVKFLSEVMDVQGVLTKRDDLIRKMEIAKSLKKPIDGHAPKLTGDLLIKYVKSGITTDHEVTNIDEAKEKIEAGLKIILRDGSASKDFQNLYPLIKEYPSMCMIGSDDKSPDDLKKGYLDFSVKLALSRGIDIFDVLYAAILNPALHYGLEIGLLRINDPADFIVVDNLRDLKILKTYVDGILVYSDNCLLFEDVKPEKINNFLAEKIKEEDIWIPVKGKRIRVIKVEEGSILTGTSLETVTEKDGLAVSDVKRDILKVVLLDRYSKEKRVRCGFVKGFGLKEGAMATSVSHDSHHIVAVGCEDRDIVEAVNMVVESKGGMAFYSKRLAEFIPLPIGGLMSDLDSFDVASRYENLNRVLVDCGVSLSHPYMTLSFVALPVIPELRITTRGLFDVGLKRWVDLFL
ncbi:MAG: adenine deaminase [Desulfobacterota bacterium]|nr:adenine deaminase [Thermodesulfobacteriota bacterium]MDW8002838.1 adenine deaminase [Deltaproteobacteria bacterium]